MLNINSVGYKICTWIEQKCVFYDIIQQSKLGNSLAQTLSKLAIILMAFLSGFDEYISFETQSDKERNRTYSPR